MDLEKTWQVVLGELEIQISKPNFLTWLKNSRLIEKNDGGVVVGLPNNFAREWVENKYHRLIVEAIRTVDDSIKKIEYVVKSPEEKERTPAKTAAVKNQATLPEFKTDPETGLNPKYSLNSFIVGSFNELAYAAGSAIIKEVGRKYNPLFIYGGVGLGKTHLIQAVGNEIASYYKGEIKVKYVSSEKFTNDVVWSIRNKRTDDMRTKYRFVDVLIIDDIQFIGGKEKTEEEFFHTFNALYENNKQIIISSDRPPQSIATLEERLRSRFEGGMIADISYPDYESRLAILRNKIQESDEQLSDEILDLIAKKVRKNIRELEGVLNKVIFHKTAKNTVINIKTADEIIRSLTAATKNINSEQVTKAVASFFEVTTSELLSKSRKSELVEPRQITMYLLREVLEYSYPRIGEKLKRDHTTVIHSCNKIASEINKNNKLNQKILLIKERIFSEEC